MNKCTFRYTNLNEVLGQLIYSILKYAVLTVIAEVSNSQMQCSTIYNTYTCGKFYHFNRNYQLGFLFHFNSMVISNTHIDAVQWIKYISYLLNYHLARINI